jgi:hypothetical protein
MINPIHSTRSHLTPSDPVGALSDLKNRCMIIRRTVTLRIGEVEVEPSADAYINRSAPKSSQPPNWRAGQHQDALHDSDGFHLTESLIAR